MFTEVLIATISVKAGTNLDHEFKEKKNKFSSAPKSIFKQEEYTMPIKNASGSPEMISSISDLCLS